MLVPQSCPTLCDSWTVVFQAPLSVEFSRQEYWSEDPFPSLQGLFPTQVLNLALVHAGRFFTIRATREAQSP